MTKAVKIKNTYIGGGNPVTVQSMTNTPTYDVEATVAQIGELEAAGCDIVRITVPDERSARCVRAIADRVKIPLVADIHFDYRLAISAIEGGVDKIRINPGNIGSDERVRAVADCARAHGVPVRVGVNGGSLGKEIRSRYGNGAEALVVSALENVRILEKHNFEDIVISVKSSDPKTVVEAYRKLSVACDYPLHLGVTEAGIGDDAVYKSVAAMGSLLLDGIGDTVRISITGNPVEEVKAGLKLLRAVGLRRDVAEIISCPTCGRCCFDLEARVREVKEKLKDFRHPIKVAVMGCIVNGPGEAGDADFGLAGGKDFSVLFRGGKETGRVPNETAADALIKMIVSEYGNRA